MNKLKKYIKKNGISVSISNPFEKVIIFFKWITKKIRRRR